MPTNINYYIKPTLIIFQSENNIFRNLPTEQYKRIREGIIKYIIYSSIISTIISISNQTLG